MEIESVGGEHVPQRLIRREVLALPWSVLDAFKSKRLEQIRRDIFFIFIL